MSIPIQAPVSTPEPRPAAMRRSAARVRLATVRSGCDGIAIDVYAAVVALPGAGDARTSLRMLEPTQILRFLAGGAPSRGPETTGVCA